MDRDEWVLVKKAPGFFVEKTGWFSWKLWAIHESGGMPVAVFWSKRRARRAAATLTQYMLRYVWKEVHGSPRPTPVPPDHSLIEILSRQPPTSYSKVSPCSTAP